MRKILSARTLVSMSKIGKRSIGTLENLGQYADHSWLDSLKVDPEHASNAPNKTMRQVRSGHYVPVLPTALPNPKLVAFSPEMASELGLSDDECKSEKFSSFFSGDIDVVTGRPFKSWCTPYALSIYGTEVVNNCPFQNGNGYGDGRAISIGEVLLEGNELKVVNESKDIPSERPTSGRRWEMQLKGAGKTPFCRGADGRAVLRSSVREFLVSEAMHKLGVSTTRALSLVTSDSEKVRRQWYSKGESQMSLPSLDDPRMASVPPEYRKMLIAQLKNELQNPNIVIMENTAITCRVAPSFIRVGHIELFARRARKLDKSSLHELRLIVEHLITREYPFINEEVGDILSNQTLADNTLQDRVIRLADVFSTRLSNLTANWIRVGFCQGNFNSDNCLAAGRTMDYGPFGFVQRFEPLWNMWSGGGEHFGFLNQPTAGTKNFESFCNALRPLLDSEGGEKLSRLAAQHSQRAQFALNCMWKQKLGIEQTDESFLTDNPFEAKVGIDQASPASAFMDETIAIIHDLNKLMTSSEADYTMLWWQLSVIAENFLDSIQLPATNSVEISESKVLSNVNCKDILEPLTNVHSIQIEQNKETLDGSKCESVFYKELSSENRREWKKWIKQWLVTLRRSNPEATGSTVATSMRCVSPKYIPREWMLVNAYEKAMKGDYSQVVHLQKVFMNPYSKSVKTKQCDKEFYTKAPIDTYRGCGVGGTSFMT